MTSLIGSIRAIDGGGNGFRRIDVFQNSLGKIVESGPIDLISNLLDFVAEDLPADLIGVAYSLAGVIENHNKVIKSPNIHFLDGVALGDLTNERTEKPAIICNDMEAAVTGMAEYFPDFKFFMGITWSSGIGLRIVKDGKILFEDSEGGHIKIDNSPFAPLCGCSSRGCAEAIFGGEALRRRVLAETEALGIRIPQGVHPCEFLSYAKGQEWAEDIYNIISTAMAVFLSNLQTVFHLPSVVWKGTVAKAVLPRVQQAVREKMRELLINPKWESDMKFYFSPEPDGVVNADAFIGAAKILRERAL